MSCHVENWPRAACELEPRAGLADRSGHRDLLRDRLAHLARHALGVGADSTGRGGARSWTVHSDQGESSTGVGNFSYLGVGDPDCVRVDAGQRDPMQVVHILVLLPLLFAVSLRTALPIVGVAWVSTVLLFVANMGPGARAGWTVLLTATVVVALLVRWLVLSRRQLAEQEEGQRARARPSNRVGRKSAHCPRSARRRRTPHVAGRRPRADCRLPRT